MTNSAAYLSQSVQPQSHQLPNEHFNLSEIRTFRLHLNVDYESMAREEKPSRIRDLLLLRSNGHLPNHIALIQQLRPSVNWRLLSVDFAFPDSFTWLHAHPTNQLDIGSNLAQRDKTNCDEVGGR